METRNEASGLSRAGLCGKVPEKADGLLVKDPSLRVKDSGLLVKPIGRNFPPHLWWAATCGSYVWTGGFRRSVIRPRRFRQWRPRPHHKSAACKDQCCCPQHSCEGQRRDTLPCYPAITPRMLPSHYTQPWYPARYKAVVPSQIPRHATQPCYPAVMPRHAGAERTAAASPRDVPGRHAGAGQRRRPQGRGAGRAGD